LKELEPLLEYLSSNKPGPYDDKQPIVFPRGTIMSGGRLDLCKQVVGPQGVQILLNAMKHSSFISRLLLGKRCEFNLRRNENEQVLSSFLGNNIVGLPGAEAISQYIRFNSDSNIDTWYIGCNKFDSECISLICDALATDTKVKALWLKRNPILAVGVVHIARMLTTNTYLQTLDLLNTGLLDEGCEILFNAFKVNHSLKHLYIDTNGLTVKSGQIIRLHFEQRHNHLETLYLSCNALGDRGTCEIAAGLKHDQCLKRLSLASNCIGSDGARALVDALIGHVALQQLNLGFMRGTNFLGHVNNVIGDDGAAEISRLIQFNHHIRSIDLTLNGISQQGLIQLRDALKANRTLTTLKGLQFRKVYGKIIKKEIKTMIGANRIEWGKQVLSTGTDDALLLTKSDYLKKGQQLNDEINFPEHITEVISHYRIQ
jgi:Ran GTPase-activating protein (RanGAP) involved in mRNA processing and transport